MVDCKVEDLFLNGFFGKVVFIIGGLCGLGLVIVCIFLVLNVCVIVGDFILFVEFIVNF